MKNKYLIWVIAGIIGTLIGADLFSVIMKILGLQLHTTWTIAADFILHGRQNIEAVYGVIIGFIMDYFFGITNAVVIGLLLEWTGYQNYLFKGIGILMFNWVVFGVMVELMPWFFSYPVNRINLLTYIPAAIIIGGIMSYTIVMLSKRFLALR